MDISDFYNSHTHSSGLNTVLNVDVNDVMSLNRFDGIQLISLGVHPWYHNDIIISEIETSLNYIKKRSDIKLVAFGEVGLDRIRGGDLSRQVTNFEILLKFSKKLNLPLVFHSVRCAEDILRITNLLEITKPCLFHDFNGSMQLIQRIQDMGHFIGIGKSIFRSESNIFKNIDKIRLNQILFETDDNNFSIESVYKEYSMLTGLDTDLVKDQVRTNFVNFFELE